MIKREVIAGDTFSIVYKHMPEGVLTDLPEGYDYVLGLRQEGGTRPMTFRLSENQIEHVENSGIYTWKISHNLSKSLKDTVVVEMLIYSEDKSFVQHCNEPVYITVIPSFMNEVIADNE